MSRIPRFCRKFVGTTEVPRKVRIISRSGEPTWVVKSLTIHFALVFILSIIKQSDFQKSDGFKPKVEPSRTSSGLSFGSLFSSKHPSTNHIYLSKVLNIEFFYSSLILLLLNGYKFHSSAMGLIFPTRALPCV